jgi:hypothetical protein
VTPLTDTRELIVVALMDAQASNAVQARLLHNATPEVDSLREILVALAARDLTRFQQLRLITRGVQLVDEIDRHNQLEREHVHSGTGAAEALGRKSMTVKDAARLLRAPLGDLANAMIGGKRRDEAIRLVLDVLDRAPEGLLYDPATGRPRAGIRGELNSVAKATELADVIAMRVTA